MAFRIVFSPEAEADLRSLYLYIAERGGEETALRYVERIESFCRGFADFPWRGRARDDLTAGLRIVGFKRRVAVAFHVESKTVVFDRILYGGRDLSSILRQP